MTRQRLVAHLHSGYKLYFPYDKPRDILYADMTLDKLKKRDIISRLQVETTETNSLKLLEKNSENR